MYAFHLYVVLRILGICEAGIDGSFLNTLYERFKEESKPPSHFTPGKVHEILKYLNKCIQVTMVHPRTRQLSWIGLYFVVLFYAAVYNILCWSFNGSYDYTDNYIFTLLIWKFDNNNVRVRTINEYLLFVTIESRIWNVKLIKLLCNSWSSVFDSLVRGGSIFQPATWF